MLVDVPLSGHRIVVVGGGTVAERKVRKLTPECPDILVASEKFTRGLMSLQKKGRIRLLKTDATLEGGPLDRALARSDILIVATSDPKLNGALARRAKRRGLMVNAADNPGACDFFFPASAAAGEVRIAVATGGSSPAMARLLCKRLSRQVSEADLSQVRLQGQIRKFAAQALHDPASRKRALYAVLRDGVVQSLLEGKRFRDAEAAARRIVLRESERHAGR